MPGQKTVDGEGAEQCPRCYVPPGDRRNVERGPGGKGKPEELSPAQRCCARSSFLLLGAGLGSDACSPTSDPISSCR